ncbi:MAG: hypothetical protein FD123_2166 [Bacteroidetes bacterium]|nr:MAG: hypothetical protein FD123_2166 [Bacteroidota bacterium]
MKQVSLFAAMITSCAVFAQDTTKTKAPAAFKRLLTGANISADYCYRILGNNDGSSSSAMIMDTRNSFERPKLGYTGGVNLCYNFSGHFGIETGVQYSNKGYRSYFDFPDTITDPRLILMYTAYAGPTPAKVTVTYNHVYLDVPVRIIFSCGEKNIRFVSSIGATTNILLQATQKSVAEYENGDIERNTQDLQDDYKMLNISPTISAGVDYRINDKINLRAEPTFRYGLLKIIDTPITGYLWNAGLNITCYYVIR